MNGLTGIFNQIKQTEKMQKQVRHACVDCHYFSGSEYLWCAVHPLGVESLRDTDEEIAPCYAKNNCPDWKLKK